LQWTTLPADNTKKITVETDLVSPNFTVSVAAIGVNAGHGTSEGPTNLSTAPANLVSSIPNNITISDPGQCSLRYTVTATAADGTGNDNHRITFTILDE
jgi:hypothetical protein